MGQRRHDGQPTRGRADRRLRLLDLKCTFSFERVSDRDVDRVFGRYEVIRRVTLNPAKALAFPTRIGSLAVESPADVAIFELGLNGFGRDSS